MNELYELFKQLGYDKRYFRQGSLIDDNWPEHFFTFWKLSPSTLLYRDNKLKTYSLDLVIYFYSNDSEFVYTEMDRFIEEAKKAKFIVEGKPYDAPSGRTDYFGQLINIRKLYKEEK